MAMWASAHPTSIETELDHSLAILVRANSTISIELHVRQPGREYIINARTDGLPDSSAACCLCSTSLVCHNICKLLLGRSHDADRLYSSVTCHHAISSIVRYLCTLRVSSDKPREACRLTWPARIRSQLNLIWLACKHLLVTISCGYRS